MVKRLTAASFLSFLIIPSANAIIVAGSNPDDPLYSGSAYTGIVRLYTPQGYCTGSLFGPSRVYVLTAAHCVADSLGNPNVNGSSYAGIDGAITKGVVDPIAAVFIAPGYIGASNTYINDLAVVQLQNAAPSDADTYSLYSSTDELGKDVTLVGQGQGGNGNTGPQAQYGITSDESGRRMGTNTYERLASTLFGSSDDTHILWDFDNGLDAQNALGPASSLGDGLREVSIAPGDSGGPSFYNGQIIGVHSYSTCFVLTAGSTACLSPPDIGPTLNGPIGTFGEIGADTRVSLYSSTFLAPFVATAVPEPQTWSLLGAGLLALVVRGRRFRAGIR